VPVLKSGEAAKDAKELGVAFVVSTGGGISCATFSISIKG
jgi:hypothetical protein